jgi:hypothetical protein
LRILLLLVFLQNPSLHLPLYQRKTTDLHVVNLLQSKSQVTLRSKTSGLNPLALRLAGKQRLSGWFEIIQVMLLLAKLLPRLENSGKLWSLAMFHDEVKLRIGNDLQNPTKKKLEAGGNRSGRRSPGATLTIVGKTVIRNTSQAMGALPTNKEPTIWLQHHLRDSARIVGSVMTTENEALIAKDLKVQDLPQHRVHMTIVEGVAKTENGSLIVRDPTLQSPPRYRVHTTTTESAVRIGSEVRSLGYLMV